MKFSHIVAVVSAATPMVLAGNLRVDSRIDYGILKEKTVRNHPTPVHGFYICGGRPDAKDIQKLYVVKELKDPICYRDGSVPTINFHAHTKIGALKRNGGSVEVFSVAVQEGGMLPGPRTLVGAAVDNTGLGEVLIKTEAKKGRFLPTIGGLKPIAFFRENDPKRKGLTGQNLEYSHHDGRKTSTNLFACPQGDSTDPAKAKYIVKYSDDYRSSPGPSCVDIKLIGDLQDCGNAGEQKMNGCVNGRIGLDGEKVEDAGDEDPLRTPHINGQRVRTGGDLIDGQSEAQIPAHHDEIKFGTEKKAMVPTKPKKLPPLEQTNSGEAGFGAAGNRGRVVRPSAQTLIADEDDVADIRGMLNNMEKGEGSNAMNLDDFSLSD